MSKKLVWIYSDIHSCNFVDTNIFGHSFISKFSRMSHSAPDCSASWERRVKRKKKTWREDARIVMFKLYNSMGGAVEKDLCHDCCYDLRVCCWKGGGFPILPKRMERGTSHTSNHVLIVWTKFRLVWCHTNFIMPPYFMYASWHQVSQPYSGPTCTGVKRLKAVKTLVFQNILSVGTQVVVYIL